MRIVGFIGEGRGGEGTYMGEMETRREREDEI